MNSLNRDLIKGEEVIVRADVLKPEYVAQVYRVFIVLDGFGMGRDTAGTAVFGKYKFDGEECRIEGFEIDALETVVYQEVAKTKDEINKLLDAMRATSSETTWTSVDQCIGYLKAIDEIKLVLEDTDEQ